MAARALPLLCVLLLIATVAAAQDGRAAPPRAVNVNTATADQLQLLPGVGPALAARIIEFREANGPFEKVDELTAVQGIGDKSLEKLRPYVVTSGATSLTEKVRLPRPKPAAAKE
ncbi:MAG TPA: helix-hairpin-helix domain-containing protein [Thermoanaerobaculales bacterium]|nr:helix-hairpin-helix domain-containing protein [Thermoanaerobaculales bacterium]HPA79216.1 helix-hairpin-helix domain-containing protein [Thermoanaerobaculales bacterium]HQL28738.1 helix-hairpin-helix domain-containing protein [Thermoanaerobaculales bacterium]HQN97273.1 helix-hairpin-helix domain-containing protein [Thermoanaerobaculales bacterium]HQP42770.1 helix-hairpin-helix domain-containing protein [Thermoanaerobaculales bacterium]